MDMVLIGKYLAELRKENGMTQEQLGEKIGVTNKTVSRWETGTYLPPVDALEQLSNLYGITINEILSGRPLETSSYKEAAEENIKTILNESAFSLNERITYFKNKWKKEHLLENIFAIILLVVIIVLGCVLDNGLWLVGLILCIIYNIINYNRMMSYIEKRAYIINDTDN